MTGKYYFVAVSALFLAGCGSNSSGPSPAPEYFPVAVGNVWNHDVSGSWENPGVDTAYVQGTMIREVTGTATHISGNQVFVFESVSELEFQLNDTTFTVSDTMYTYGFDADSEFIGYDDTLSADYEIVMKLPPTVGETWEPMTDDPTIVREVLSVTSSVSVPAGNFSNCVLVRDTDTDDPAYLWEMYLANGVGPVYYRAEEADGDTEIYTEVELQSYVIN